MSEFHKGYRDCKKFEFKVGKKRDVQRIFSHFESRDYMPMPKEFLVKAE